MRESHLLLNLILLENSLHLASGGCWWNVKKSPTLIHIIVIRLIFSELLTQIKSDSGLPVDVTPDTSSGSLYQTVRGAYCHRIPYGDSRHHLAKYHNNLTLKYKIAAFMCVNSLTNDITCPCVVMFILVSLDLCKILGVGRESK